MASTSRRTCVNHPDVFCYVCGEYTLKESKKTISDFVKRAYLAYFGVHLGDQDKSWAPHFICKTCVEHLRQWTEDDTETSTSDEVKRIQSENDSDFEADLATPQCFNQEELNDLIRDLNLLKESPELLASRLKEN
ncbi:uncharacterized protein LOC123310968 [Coccinella septempunctata]|uniref:uncharacterized protein LOC123310967 n=1 Tax=Coccinella septempunctata TaxID=41139 RepID=UPI001D07A5B5|nr:uncharacterized protein LOC123310967 [Coccinella septempunctata]XP_044750630.1 uncharacterized protein LOC123310968 [Coccinella septempunctata]